MDGKRFRAMALAMQTVAEHQAKLFASIVKKFDAEGGETTEEEVQEPKNKKNAGKKKVEEDEEPGEVADDDSFLDDDNEEKDEGPTLVQVRKIVKDFAAKHGKAKALKLLGKFKTTAGEPVGAIPDIKKADYAKVLELAKKHL